MSCRTGLTAREGGHFVTFIPPSGCLQFGSLVYGDVVGPDAVGGGVVGGAEAGEGAEVVCEVGLVVVAAGESELGPWDVGALVHLLKGLLEALDAAVELG